MPMPDLQPLLRAATEEPPCGPDLEYDAQRLQLDQALAGRPGQQYGTHVVDAVPPDWPQVLALAGQQLRRSKDLRPAAAWTRAATRLYGLEGCAAGLELLHGLMRIYWPGLHPLDDEDGPWARQLCLESLGHEEGLPLDLSCAAEAPDAARLYRRVAEQVDAIDLLWQQLTGEVPLDLWRLRQRLQAGEGAAVPARSGVGAPAQPPWDLVAARADLDAALEWIDRDAAATARGS